MDWNEQTTFEKYVISPSSEDLLLFFFVFGSFFVFEFGIVNEDQNDGKGAVEPSNVVVIAPVATNEDEDEDDATINKWSKIRVKALKFNENTYYSYIVLAVIFIASIALVRSSRLYIALPTRLGIILILFITSV